MAWSSGVFTRLYNWVNDRDAGTKILATKMDAEMDGFATGINTCLTKDGQNTPTADLPMSGQKHTGIGNASARDQYPAVGQIQDGGLVYAQTTGSADAYVLTLSPAISSLVTGMVVNFRANFTNTTATPTLNVNGTGAVQILSSRSHNLQASDIVNTRHYRAFYNGATWLLSDPIAAGINGNQGVVALAPTSAIDTGTSDTVAVTPAGLVHFADGSSTQKLAKSALASPLNTASIWTLLQTDDGTLGGNNGVNMDFEPANYADYNAFRCIVSNGSHDSGTSRLIQLRIGTGATPTYQTGSIYYTNTTNNNEWNLSGTHSDGNRWHAVIEIFNVGDNAESCHGRFHTYVTDSSQNYQGLTSGFLLAETTSAVSALRLYFNGGDWDVGEIKWYGAHIA